MDVLAALVGQRLSIVRRAADMLVLHFGEIKTHPSGEGTIGSFALHVQCPWRFDGPTGTHTGSVDLWDYDGPGERPPNWSYEDGRSLQDKKFESLFVWDEVTRSWLNHSDDFAVIEVRQSKTGDVTLALANGFSIAIFPAGSKSEAWRLISWESRRHFVFPTERDDVAISRRKRDDSDSEYEVWLKVIAEPTTGTAVEAPPAVMITKGGARYRCGGCGTVLLIAELGALKDFAVLCRSCGRFNQVPL